MSTSNKRTPLVEASDPETPFSRLFELSESEDVEVRRAIVDNPSIAVKEDGVVTKRILLDLVMEFPDEIVRSPAFAIFGLELKDPAMVVVARTIAYHSKDPQVLEFFFQEFREDFSLRKNIALNANSPLDILRILGNAKTESDRLVRRNAARNPNTPESVLRILGNVKTEPDDWVRHNVATNPSTPADVLRILRSATEPDIVVRGLAEDAMAERGFR